MHADSELLRLYLEQKSERAFTELVQRHLGLVYSVALRRVGGDTQLAEDVTQKVFTDLARKAPSLVDRPTLGGWLYASAHLASAAVVRAERRRKTRETEAHLMQTTLSSSDSESDRDWARLRPVIDDVIVALKDQDREAVALRFFEKRSFAEVGAALRVTEEAARKRVDRALEKLRGLLARRGITSTAAALGLALGAIGAATAPVGLGTKIAAHAVVSAPAGSSFLGSLGGTVWPAAAALVIGSVLISSQSNTSEILRTKLARLTADHGVLVGLRAENDRLARELAAFSRAWELTPAAAPAVAEPTPAPRQILARITLSPQGTIAWNGEPVKLYDFVTRVRTLQATGDPEGRVHIRGVGAEFLPLTYVIEEVRRAQLNHVTVESTATPDPARHPQGFWF